MFTKTITIYAFEDDFKKLDDERFSMVKYVGDSKGVLISDLVHDNEIHYFTIKYKTSLLEQNDSDGNVLLESYNINSFEEKRELSYLKGYKLAVNKSRVYREIDKAILNASIKIGLNSDSLFSISFLDRDNTEISINVSTKKENVLLITGKIGNKDIMKEITEKQVTDWFIDQFNKYGNDFIDNFKNLCQCINNN
jgi:hypothetical protein